MAEADRAQVFISYSHEDRKWKDKLVAMLQSYVREQV
jgi:hypothetical protein